MRRLFSFSLVSLLVAWVSCDQPAKVAQQVPPPPSGPHAYIGGTDGDYHGLNCPKLPERNRECEAVNILEDAGYRPCPTCGGKEMPLAEFEPVAREVEAAPVLPLENPPSQAQVNADVDFSGECVGISDGDTISVMRNGRPEKIRLHGIDCPESHQDYGTRAKQFTSDLVFRKTVGVEVKDRDQYGRTVGVVYTPDRQCLNHALVAAGFAWWYRQYAPGDRTLERLEADARSAKRGLWADPHAVAPWDFRRGGTSVANEFGSPRPEQQRQAGQPTVTGTGEVYVTPTGKKYHRRNCRTLSRSRSLTAMTPQEAASRGYGPCGVCKP